METESYYEIIAENTRNGNVERRIVQCLDGCAEKNRNRATQVFESLRKAGFNYVEGRHVEVRTTPVEWLSYDRL